MMIFDRVGGGGRRRVVGGRGSRWGGSEWPDQVGKGQLGD